METRVKKIFLVAGEASSDRVAASLIQELRKKMPIEVVGIGGTHLRKAGMKVIVDSSELSVVGLADWSHKFLHVMHAFRKTCDIMVETQPDLVLLLDLPDFNILLAKQAKHFGFPIYYYISPQVWAWRKYRVRTLRRLVEKMLVILPFEEPFYKERGVPVEFVGHPLASEIAFQPDFRSTAERLAEPQVAVLPGSRKSELKFNSGPLNAFAQAFKKKHPKAKLHLPIAPSLDPGWVETLYSSDLFELTSKDSRHVMADSDIALVCSGTATLECSLIGTPFLILYVLSPSSFWFMRKFFRYRSFLGLPNVLLGKEAAKEFIQGDATAEKLVSEAEKLLLDEGYRAQQVADWKHCRELLGNQNATQRVAEIVSQRLDA